MSGAPRELPDAGPRGAASRPSHNPWLIALTVTMATFMEVLDTSIANVALPHIAGGLSASYDEATWVLTSYLVSNAIILPLSGWLATVFGRKRFYMTCVALFTLSSMACGFAPSLTMLIIFRVLQGAGGGGLAPSEQAILADTFPPAQLGVAFSVYGMAVVLAPAIGPTLGGWITDNYNWRWVFFINLPVGLISLMLTHRMIQDPPHLIAEKKRAWARGLSIDYIGLGLIALGLGTLQVVLDKGQEDDWFGSSFILWFTIIAAVSLIAATLWEWFREDPIVDVRMLGRRTFGIASFLMFVVGVVLYGTTVMLPQFTQTLLGYTAERAGMALSPGGFVIILIMPLVGRLTARVDSRKLIAFGLLASGFALYHMTNLDLYVSFWTVVMYRVYQAIGLAFLFIPINTISYVGVPPEKNNQVSGIINLFRNLGGSVGISVVSTLIARRAQVHQDTLSLHTNDYQSAFRSAVNGISNFYIAHGSSPADAAHHGLAQFYASMQAQASMLAYLDTLWLLAIACFAIVPLVFVMRKNKPGASQAHAH